MSAITLWKCLDVWEGLKFWQNAACSPIGTREIEDSQREEGINHHQKVSTANDPSRISPERHQIREKGQAVNPIEALSRLYDADHGSRGEIEWNRESK